MRFEKNFPVIKKKTSELLKINSESPKAGSALEITLPYVENGESKNEKIKRSD